MSSGNVDGLEKCSNGFDNPLFNGNLPINTIYVPDEKPPITDKNIQLYARRWYIVFLFSLLAGIQALVWIFWGPIAATSEHAYGWKDSDIAFFNNWGPITFIPMALPIAWLTDRKGLRYTVLAGMLLVTAATGIKCIDKNPPNITWLTHAGQCLNGMVGPIAMGAVTTISSTWFPPHQRATATSIMYSAQTLFIAISFILGPFLVPETFKRLNETDQNRSIFVNTTTEIDEVVRIERDNIIYYSYGVFGFCVLLLITMFIYFPNKPPSPPSPSASRERLDYKSGLKQLMRNGQFWFIAIIYGLSTGTRDSWSSMIDVNFKEHNVSQVEVGWIAFTSAIASVVATIIVARFADKFTRRLKIFLIFLFFSTTVMYLWLILTLLNVIPFHKDYLFISDVLASLLNGATSPLFYELSCEITYPVAEGVTNVVITTQNNVAALIFLGIFFIPGIGTMWMNWALLAAYGLGTIALFFLTETHHRLDVDEHKID
ncbi:hypothetical protein SNE40_023203 [Patella caerulea]|uniref:Uncharacterized protein n=1 Tax=Patella caerulea TaxID=87958 RepID=A0AAN8FY32_PATCE